MRFSRPLALGSALTLVVGTVLPAVVFLHLMESHLHQHAPAQDHLCIDAVHHSDEEHGHATPGMSDATLGHSRPTPVAVLVAYNAPPVTVVATRTSVVLAPPHSRHPLVLGCVLRI